MAEIDGGRITAQQLVAAGIDTLFGVVAGPMIEVFAGAQAEGMRPLKDREDVATLFSGGVDSTLIHTYLGPKTAALNLIADSDDATSAMETEYANSAAGWLGAAIRPQEVRQSEFLRDLELATENAALPMHLGMLAVFARAFSDDYETYISGWSADALFGHSARFNRIASSASLGT